VSNVEGVVDVCLALSSFELQVHCGRHFFFAVYRAFSLGASDAIDGETTLRRTLSAVQALPALSIDAECREAAKFEHQFGRLATGGLSFAYFVRHLRALPSGTLAAPEAFDALEVQPEPWILGPPMAGLEAEYRSLMFEHDGRSKHWQDLRWRSAAHSTAISSYPAVAVTMEKPLREGHLPFLEIVSGPFPSEDLLSQSRMAIGDVAKAANAMLAWPAQSSSNMKAILDAALQSRWGHFEAPPSQQCSRWHCLNPEKRPGCIVVAGLPGPAVHLTEEWNLTDLPSGRFAEAWAVESSVAESSKKYWDPVAPVLPLTAFEPHDVKTLHVGSVVETVFRAAQVLAQTLKLPALLQGWVTLALWGQLHHAVFKAKMTDLDPLVRTFYKNTFFLMPNTDMAKLWRYVRRAAGPWPGDNACEGARAAFPHLQQRAPAADAVFKDLLTQICGEGEPTEKYLQQVTDPFAYHRNQLLTSRCAADLCLIAVEARGFDERSFGLRRSLDEYTKTK